MIFSEKEAAYSKFSKQVKVGDIFEAKVGSVEDYGAFVHLRFPDGNYYTQFMCLSFLFHFIMEKLQVTSQNDAGLYHLTGLIHISEVSWDLVQDVRDFLTDGDEVRVKVINIDR